MTVYICASMVPGHSHDCETSCVNQSPPISPVNDRTIIMIVFKVVFTLKVAMAITLLIGMQFTRCKNGLQLGLSLLFAV